MKDRGTPSEVIGKMGMSGYLLQRNSQNGRTVSTSKTAAVIKSDALRKKR
jgi:hypothetical protein